MDFNAPEYQRPPDSGPAAPTSASALSLPAACREWFRTMSPAVRSCWALLVAVPCALPLGRLLANACPDTVLATHIAVRPQGLPYRAVPCRTHRPVENEAVPFNYTSVRLESAYKRMDRWK